jgi:hypothetical protein
MPAKLRDLRAAIKALCPDVRLEPAPGGGSHWRFVRDGRVYPVPAPNAERSDIGDFYIMRLCRFLGIDERESRKRL